MPKAFEHQIYVYLNTNKPKLVHSCLNTLPSLLMYVNTIYCFIRFCLHYLSRISRVIFNCRIQARDVDTPTRIFRLVIFTPETNTCRQDVNNIKCIVVFIAWQLHEFWLWLRTSKLDIEIRRSFVFHT